MRRTDRLASACALVLVAVGVAGCGGSTKTTTTAKAPPTRTATTPIVKAQTNTVTTGPVHATLRAPNHSPVMNKGWPYAVSVMDASGHPLSGTVTVQFLFGGQVVGRDTPPTHPLRNGRWHDVLKFPPRSVGIPLTFETVVHTPAGTVTLNWPVKVKP